MAANADIIYDVELIAIESGDDNREVRVRARSDKTISTAILSLGPEPADRALK